MGPDLKVGFLGLGSMGLGMASCLVKDGYDVAGFDVNLKAMEDLAYEGGKAFGTPKATAAHADVLMVVVATSDQASLVLFDSEKGALAGLRNDAVIMLCITATPEYATETKKRLESFGRSDVKLIDCPISGGVTRAWDGTLSFLLAGDEQDISSIREVLDCLGSKLHIISSNIGAGSSIKMVHQILVGIHILATVEMMGLAFAAGLDLRLTYDSVMDGDGSSWLFEQRAAHIIDSSRVPASSLMIITKDLAILKAYARQNAVSLPLTSLTHQVFVQATSSGCNTDDDCSVLRTYLRSTENVDNLGKRPTSHRERRSNLSQDSISKLLIGIHAAAAIEMLKFADALGLSLSILSEVVKDAAGSSAMFSKICASPWPAEAEISLRSIDGFEKIAQDMVLAIGAAEALKYPLSLSTAALQQFHES